MSSVIDEKIVKMTFDNSGFDSRIKSSMASLTMFKKELNLDGAASGAESSLSGLAKTANSVDMDSLILAIQTVGKRFTTMGLVGMNIINQLSTAAVNLGTKLVKAIPSQIMSGGWARASNVAQAKFQLEGLGIAWENVADDIDHAVQDTSYGADAAAKAASQLAASGVAYGGVIETLADGTKVYSDMGRALRGISGTAAMTNSSYEEIADIFTTVAGQGKLMTMQLNQLAGRGLNVAATLADQWGKTEAEVREMVSKGKVQFQDFADAMDSAFGEHATKANETLSGSLSNMKAALSRIGQDFAQTILSETPQVFNSLKGFFNQIRKYTKPFADNIFTPIFAGYMKQISNIIKSATDKLPKLDKGSDTLEKYNQLLKYLQNILNGVINTGKNVAGIFKPIGQAFNEVFGGPSIEKIGNFSKRFLYFANNLKLSSDTFDKVKRVAKGFFSIFDIAKTLFGQLLSSMSPLLRIFGSFGDIILTVSASVADLIVEFDKMIKETNIFEGAFNKIREVCTKVANTFEEFKEKIKDIFKIDTSVAEKVTEGLSERVNAFQTALGRTGEVLSKIAPLFSAAFNAIGRIGAQAFNMILDAVDNFTKGASFSDLLNFLNGIAIADLSYAALGLVKSLVKIKDTVLAPVGQVRSILMQVKNTLIIMQKEIQANIIRSIAISIAILVAALVVLSHIDFDKVVTGLVAIGGVLTMLMLALNGIMKTAKDFSSIAVEQKGGIFGFFVNLKNSVAGFIDAWRERTKLTAMGVVIMELAAAVGILAIAMKILSTIPTDQLARSAIVVVVMIGSLVGSLKIMSTITKDLPKMSAVLISFSLAMLVLSKALKTISDIDANSLALSTIALISLMAALSLFVTFMSVVGKKLSISDALVLLAFAGSVAILVKALKQISELSTEELTKGIVGIGGLMLILATSMILLGEASPLAILGAGALLIMAGALLVLIPAFTAFAKMPWREIGAGLAKISTVITVLGLLSGILGIISPLIALAGMSFIILGKALIVLAAGFLVFGSINFERIFTALASFSLLSLVITGLSIAIAPFIPELLAFTVAMALLGAAMFAISGTTEIFIREFSRLTEYLKGEAPGIADLIVQIVTMVSKTLTDNLFAHIDEILQALADVIFALSEAIESSVDILIPALNRCVEAVFYALGMLIMDIPGVISSALKGLGRAFGVEQEILDGFDEMQAISEDGLRAMFSSLFTIGNTNANTLGENIISGLKHALLGGSSVIFDAAAALGNSAIEGIRSKKGIDSNSPSKRAIESGEYVSLGFIQGMTRYLSSIFDTGEKVGKTSVDGITSSIEKNKRKIKEASSYATTIGYKLDIKDETNVDRLYELSKYNELLEERQKREAAAAEAAKINEASMKASQNSYAKGLEEQRKYAEQVNAQNIKMAEDSYKKSQEIQQKRMEENEKFRNSEAQMNKKYAMQYKKTEEDITNTVEDAYRRRNAVLEKGIQGYYARQAVDASAKSNRVQQMAAGEALENEKIVLEKEREMYQEYVKIGKISFEDYMSFIKENDAALGNVYSNEQKRIQEQVKQIKLANESNSKVSEERERNIHKLTLKEEQMGKQINKTTEASKNKIQTFLHAHDAERYLKEQTEKHTEALSKNEKALKSNGEAMDSTAKSAKKLKNEMQDMRDSIEKSLESKTGGMNFFNKLELKAETSASTILENMKSNVDGVASYTARLGQLMEKGLNKGLVDTLKDAGLDAYDEISAFLTMTDEQIAEANDLFLKAAEGRAYAANTITDKYYTLGSDNMQGMIDGIASKEKAVSDQAVEVAENAHKDVETLEGHASPSKWWIQLGTDNMQGLDIGMLKGAETYVYPNITFIINRIHRIFNEQMNGQSSEIYNIGLNFSKGLSQGILAGEKDITDATKKITSLIPKESKDALEEKSPSKLAFRIGRFFDMGLINGLTDLQNELKMTSKDVASSAIDPMQEAFDNANDFIGKNINVNPVIKPILDISNVANGMSEVSSMFDAGQAVKIDAMQNDWSNPTVRDSFLDTFANRIGLEYADRVVDAINNKDMDANVHLEGDAEGIFKVVRKGNRAFMRRTGYSGI